MFFRLASIALSCLTLTLSLSAQAEDRSHLVVIVSADQLRPDYLDTWRPAFGPRGFRRLMDEGVHCAAAAYPYGITETAPGHATIGTGALPREHGIVANQWFDPDDLKAVYCVGNGDDRSAAALLATTFGDALKLANDSRSAVVSLSGKDRSAILMAGKLADGVFWFDDATGSFVTSKPYRRDAGPGQEIAAAVAAFNTAAPRPADRWLGKTWTRLLDPDDPKWKPLYAALPPDANAFERPPLGLKTAFDHVLPAKGHQLLLCTPFANELLVELAVRLLEDQRLALARRGAPSLMCISFSANDYIGHAFGPASHEVLDVTVRLDALLATLMDALDRTVGRGKWTLALTADHGVGTIPEYAAALGQPASRVDVNGVGGLVERVSKTVAKALGDSLPAGFAPVRSAGQERGRALVRSTFGRFEEPIFALDRAQLAKLGLDPARVAVLVRDAFAAEPSIACAELTADLRAGRFEPGSIAERLALSEFPGRSGDVLACIGPGLLAGGGGPGSATSHGTPHEYDRRVPLLFVGPLFAKGATLAEACSPADIVPTLCAVFGVAKPPTSSGRVVFAALAEPLRSASRPAVKGGASHQPGLPIGR